MRAPVLPIFLLAALFAAPPVIAAVAVNSCEPVSLTPDQRIQKSDIVFEGKVIKAVCQCLPLGSGDNSFGAKAECTDTLEVMKRIKGITGPQFVFKNIAMIDEDPKANMSEWTCNRKIDDRNSKLVGRTGTYFLKQHGYYFSSVPATECK